MSDYSMDVYMGGGWVDAVGPEAIGLSPDNAEQLRRGQAIEAARAAKELAEKQAELDDRLAIEQLRDGRPHTQVIADASVAQDRLDRREQKLEQKAAQELDQGGSQGSGLNKFELERQLQEREESKSPVEKEVSKQSQAVTQLKSKLHALGGKP